jgi:thiosulfate reductase cytochrome b subunit
MLRSSERSSKLDWGIELAFGKTEHSGSVIRIHPLTVRVTHWINALAVLVMVTSGWRIYNASPLFAFVIPPGVTLGGWLAGALLWHFAAMWVLALNGLIYLAYGIASGHFRRTLLPLTPTAIMRDLVDALRGRLPHELGIYNAAQRLGYLGVILVLVALVLSGLVLWKPVQFQGLAALMGGYEGARLVHFFAMCLLVVFVVVHVVMVILVPRTFLPMWSGRAKVRRHSAPAGSA